MRKNKKNILVIAAHPDDEVLGCGGTIVRHVSQGDNVIVCIVCEGETIRNISQSSGRDILKANKILGVSKTTHLKMPDQKLDTISLVDIISKLENIIYKYKPNIIYTHHGGDINKDHKIVFDATLVATRPFLTYIKSIYTFSTVSSTEWGYPRSFIPDTWVDITKYLEIKLKAMSAYVTEIMEYPHPRSIESLINKAHAEGNQCCMEAAETFMTIRRCIRNDQKVI